MSFNVEQIFYYILSIIFISAAVYIWLKADKIRQSKRWYLGWLVYMVCIVSSYNFTMKATYINYIN